MLGQKNQRRLLKFPVMCQTDQGGVMQQTWNHQQNQSVQKPRWFEGRNPDPKPEPGPEPELKPERPKFRAFNSPAALARWSSGESGLTLPKPCPPSSRSHVASSSSNKGFREQDVYHIPTAPPGSYRDDDTGPSPKTLLMAVSGMKTAVNYFAKILIADINKHPVELEFLKQSILHETKAEVDRPNHWKFLVQAFLCQRLFEGFTAPNGYFGLEDFQTDRMSTLVSFADFTKFKDKAASIAMLMDGNSPDVSFLGRFCFKKFKFICGEVASNLPLLIYQEEWHSVAQGRHPKTVFYQNFLKAAVSVWLLHRLAHSFDQKVELLSYEKGSTFQRETMESIIPGSYDEGNEENDVNFEVCFTVIPGFQVNKSVAKCEVYLHDKVTLSHMETSIDKMPVRSLQTSESFSSYSNHSGRLPLKVGDLVSSVPEVKAATTYWNDHRESLSPGNQGTGRKSRNEQKSSAEVHPASYSRSTTIHRMPAPPQQTRSSSLRGPHHAARPTALSEMRRLANVRPTPSG